MDPAQRTDSTHGGNEVWQKRARTSETCEHTPASTSAQESGSGAVQAGASGSILPGAQNVVPTSVHGTPVVQGTAQGLIIGHPHPGSLMRHISGRNSTCIISNNRDVKLKLHSVNNILILSTIMRYVISKHFAL